MENLLFLGVPIPKHIRVISTLMHILSPALTTALPESGEGETKVYGLTGYQTYCLFHACFMFTL